MLKIKYGRRRFLRQAGRYGLASLAAAGGLAILNGCNGKQEAEKPGSEELSNQYKSALDAAQEAADPCNNTLSLSQDELATRENFEYESRSSDGTDLCRTCDFWRPSSKGDLCGTCTLMKGPIHPLGTCISWEEKSV